MDLPALLPRRSTVDPADRGDPGLFGPESVSWQVHGDPAMWLAGICSLYWQALHPRAVAAVAQNSRFREDPLGRLMRTGDYVATTTYGSRAEADRAAAKVRHVHETLSAVDPRTGEGIRLDDPELLLWVHCAEVSAFAYVVRRAGFPLTDRHLDRYFDEQRRSAAQVGLDPQRVPGSRREMAAYFVRVRPQLARTPESEQVYRFLHRPMPQWWLAAAQVGYAPVGHLAYSALPVWARRIHGRRSFPQSMVTAGLRGFRAAGLAVPGPLRWRFPGDHVQRAVQRLGRPAFPAPESLPST